jgi:hypothetical protein
MITAEVWQAVALSFGAEPMTVRGLAWDCRDGEFDECPPDFRDRLEIACNHIEKGTLRAEGAGQIPFRKVALAEFSEWALAPPRNWRLPKQFPRTTPASSAVVEADPSGDIGEADISSIPTGTAGRPSKGKHLIEDEYRRRIAAGQVESALADEAKALFNWYIVKYPKEQRPTEKTITNNLRILDRARWALRSAISRPK